MIAMPEEKPGDQGKKNYRGLQKYKIQGKR